MKLYFAFLCSQVFHLVIHITGLFYFLKEVGKIIYLENMCSKGRTRDRLIQYQSQLIYHVKRARE